MNFKPAKLATALASSALLTLTACGGGSSSNDTGSTVGSSGTTTPTPSPLPPVKLTGKVFIDQAVKNALVCMDLNANNVCDTAEPRSANTDVDGAYSLSYDPNVITAAQVAAAPMIAQIFAGTQATGASIDAGDAASTVSNKAYALSAPSGQTGQINPLTTLVQVGIASGLTRATSEAAVALQLGFPAAEIYDYQTNAAFNDKEVHDNARLMAKITASALEQGATLSVIDSANATTAAASDQLASLTYTDANNYYIRTFSTDNKVNPNTGRFTLTDLRSGKTAGTALAHDVLYPTVYLTATGGWVRCDELAALTSTIGTPSRSSYCTGSSPSAGFTIETDLSGLKMADVVTQMQAETDSSNTITMSPTLLGVAVFPTGAKLNKRKSLNLAQNIFINNTNTDGGVAGAKSLETTIAARPSASVNLTTGSGTIGLGLIDATHALRVAFKDTISAAQFYSCDYVLASNSISNCALSTTGTFAISTVNGVRIISFADHPVTTMSHVRGLVEYSGGVAIFRKNKPDLASNLAPSQRLNGPAWVAMKSVLGL